MSDGKMDLDLSVIETRSPVSRAATSSNPMLQLFVKLGWETGARSGELLQLEWSDVDFGRALLTFANDPSRGRQQSRYVLQATA